ncbi:MAG: hypothetical protein ACXVRS_11985 [Gaiellaceae bacterium]
MMVRTRLMLECPHCGESKLINVTILDDVVGPVMCESCVARTIMERRVSRLDESATPSNGSTPDVPRLEVARPAVDEAANPGRAA